MTTPHPTSTTAATALIVVSLIWAGLLLGVSFLATPAKFLAPTLSLPVALDVGRQTFAVFSIVEVVAAFVLLGIVVLYACSPRTLALAAGVTVLVAAEALWLLPALDARVEIYIAGGAPGDSIHHDVYVALELVKLALLAGLAYAGFALRAGAAP